MKFGHYMLVGLLAVAAGCVPDEPKVSEKKPVKPWSEVKPLYLPVEIMGRIIKATQVEYVRDKPGNDVWQTPEQTVARGKGDCEDIAILLQHELAKSDVAAEVVLGLKHIYAKHGHAWCEFEYEGQRYVIEPASGICYRRAGLPKELYYPAREISTVAKKIKAYYDRTGVWVNSEYHDWIKKGNL